MISLISYIIFPRKNFIDNLRNCPGELNEYDNDSMAHRIGSNIFIFYVIIFAL